MSDLRGLIRTEVSLLINNSGGDLSRGDVVIVDDSLAMAFTTTTTGAYSNGKIGVLLEAIADGEPGIVCTSGEVPQINLSASASLGDLVKTHTVAGQGVPHAAPRVEGDFAQVLGTGTSPKAILFGTPTAPQATATFPTIELIHVATSTTRTTTSSSYADIDAANMDITFNKEDNATDLLIDLTYTLYTTAQPTRAVIGLAENGNDHDIVSRDLNTTNNHTTFTGYRKISGLAAGNYTFRPRWKRTVATGTITADVNSFMQIKIQEVNP